MASPHEPPCPVRPSSPFTLDQCRWCWVALGGNAKAPVPEIVSKKLAAKRTRQRPRRWRPDCRHLGDATGEVTVCSTCPTSVRLKVLACAIHGQCTQAKKVQGLACCEDCGQREDPPTTTTAIRLNGGIGDVFAVESLMRPEERERVGTIYNSCPSADEVEQLFQALPNFPRLTNYVREIGADVPGALDWSIGAIFPKAHDKSRPYIGSSFLTYKLASPELPPSPYCVIVPVSSWGKWRDRGFDDEDWSECLAFLTRHKVYGVVLNKDSSPLPNHPWLIGWQTKTNILESIEILKAASGYVGIDSCLSVLAAKLFPGHRLCVKSKHPHLHQWKHVYYAPRVDFGFIRPHVEAPAWN